MRKKIITVLILISILACCFLSYNYGYTVGRKKEAEILTSQIAKLELENSYKAKTIELMKEGIKNLSDKLEFVDEPFVNEIIPILQKMEFEEDWVKLDAYLKECIEFWFPEHGTE